MLVDDAAQLRVGLIFGLLAKRKHLSLKLTAQVEKLINVSLSLGLGLFLELFRWLLGRVTLLISIVEDTAADLLAEGGDAATWSH